MQYVSPEILWNPGTDVMIFCISSMEIHSTTAKGGYMSPVLQLIFVVTGLLDLSLSLSMSKQICGLLSMKVQTQELYLLWDLGRHQLMAKKEQLQSVRVV